MKHYRPVILKPIPYTSYEDYYATELDEPFQVMDVTVKNACIHILDRDILIDAAIEDINACINKPESIRMLGKAIGSLTDRVLYVQKNCHVKLDVYGAPLTITYQGKGNFDLHISVLVGDRGETFDLAYRYPIDLWMIVREGKSVYAHASSSANKKHFKMDCASQFTDMGTTMLIEWIRQGAHFKHRQKA